MSADKEYIKKWKKQNKDKVSKMNRTYYLKNIKELRIKKYQYYLKNREELCIKRKKHYLKQKTEKKRHKLHEDLFLIIGQSKGEIKWS